MKNYETKQKLSINRENEKNYHNKRSKVKVLLYFLSQTKVRHPKPSCHDAHESCNKEH